MGTVNTSFFPASSGFQLGRAGNQGQRWQVNATSATADSFQSTTAGIALTGTVRLASTDFIGWREDADLADLQLSKTGPAAGVLPADVLNWNGGGIQTPAFISNTANPSSTGAVRLAGSDVIKWRNNGNGADLAGLTHNSDDTFTVGDTAGASFAGPVGGNPTLSGNVTVSGTLTAPTLQTASTTALTIQATAAAMTIKTTSPGTTANGPDVTISPANGGSVSGNGGSIVLQPGGFTSGANGSIKLGGNVSFYNNLNTTGSGLSPQYATVDVVAHTTAIGTTTLYAVPSGGAGQYRLSWNAKVTSVDAVSSTLGALTISYTDPDGVAQTITAGALTSAGAIATTSTTNTTAAVLLGVPLLLNCKVGTNVTYAMAYVSNTPGSMAYNLHVKLEFLG